LRDLITRAAATALSPEGLDRDTAVRLLDLEAPEDIHLLMAEANRLRSLTLGDQIELCAIVNARSGRCGEDCAFCAQSIHHQAQIETYALLDQAAIMETAAAARSLGVTRFSIVISGKGVSPGRELNRIAQAIEAVADLGLSPCASLGLLDDESARVLKAAGLVTYHHNLETAPEFYPKICTTHSITERIETARRAKDHGFRLCCGGIFGLGESRRMRAALALALRDLQPDSVPLNVLNPIPGTPLAGAPPLSPLEILKTIAVFRLIFPRTDLRTCGGRERNLRGLQPLMFLAGANATMTGNYLTTTGRSPEEDLRDIEDLGLKIKKFSP